MEQISSAGLVIHCTLEQYIRDPVGREKAEAMQKRAHRLAVLIWMVTFLLTATFVCILGFGLGSGTFAFAGFIFGLVPSLIAALRIVEYWQGRSDRQLEFTIDQRLLMGGDQTTAFDFIEVETLDLLNHFKAPDSIRLIQSVMSLGRPLMRCEKSLLDEIEHGFKEAVY
jgi:hypothetical protein